MKRIDLLNKRNELKKEIDLLNVYRYKHPKNEKINNTINEYKKKYNYYNHLLKTNIVDTKKTTIKF